MNHPRIPGIRPLFVVLTVLATAYMGLCLKSQGADAHVLLRTVFWPMLAFAMLEVFALCNYHARLLRTLHVMDVRMIRAENSHADTLWFASLLVNRKAAMWWDQPSGTFILSTVAGEVKKGVRSVNEAIAILKEEEGDCDWSDPRG